MLRGYSPKCVVREFYEVRAEACNPAMSRSTPTSVLAPGRAMLHTYPRREECEVEPEKTSRERAEDPISLLVPTWRPTPRQGLWAIRIAIVLGTLIAIGYSYGITLWDWANLLIVPAVIAGGGVWFANQRASIERLRNNTGRKTCYKHTSIE